MKITNYSFLSFCVLASIIYSNCSYALNVINQSAVHNEFLFVENNIDNDYFITTATREPRFTGASTWTKYDTGQVSLGYMGLLDWLATSSYYKDMWIDNSPINEPFNGIRCTKGSGCPSSGYIAADYTDHNGFYHTKATQGGTNGGAYGFASFTNSAYDYFRSMAVGASETYNLNFCYTTNEYSPSNGERCKDQNAGAWVVKPFTVTKQGHLSLFMTNASEEIWIGSDGTPTVDPTGTNCHIGIVQDVDGIICKALQYNLNQTQDVTNSLYFTMYTDDDLLGFKPKASSIKYSGDGENWSNYSAKIKYSKVFNTSGEYVYIFLSKDFLKSTVESKSRSDNNGFFTFALENTVIYHSGYYQFTPSLNIKVIPKDYGISIVSEDNKTYAKGKGNLGDSSPIELNYVVTVSGPRQADYITAQVIGDGTTLNETPYCIFTLEQSHEKIPFPAYIEYTDKTGSNVKKSNSCIEPELDIKDARWEEAPWDANQNDSGNYYTTHINLLFPMDDDASKKTVTGDDWEGIASATGEIKVTAKWIGVE